MIQYDQQNKLRMEVIAALHQSSAKIAFHGYAKDDAERAQKVAAGRVIANWDACIADTLVNSIMRNYTITRKAKTRKTV